MGGESLCGHSVPLAQTQLTTVWLAFDFQHGSLTRSTLSAYALFMRETLTFAWNNSEWISFSSINQLLVCYCFTDILHLDNIRGRQKKRKRKKRDVVEGLHSFAGDIDTYTYNTRQVILILFLSPFSVSRRMGMSIWSNQLFFFLFSCATAPYIIKAGGIDRTEADSSDFFFRSRKLRVGKGRRKRH
jgi:hypothetical protein